MNSANNTNTGAENSEALETENSTTTETLNDMPLEAESTEAELETPQVVEREAEQEEPSAVPQKEEMLATDDLEEVEEEEEANEAEFSKEEYDFSSYDKKEFLALAERMLDALKKSDVKVTDVRNIDSVSKELKAAYDEQQDSLKEEALQKYKEETGSEDGFEFKNDNLDIRFETTIIQIRETKTAFFKRLDALKEDYLEKKSALLQELREVVELEEKGGSKENWESFKRIQHAWKDAGNVPSPHNGALWSAYNALLDRYFDIRSIQNELKDLDRKKNLETRTELVERIEEIAATLQTEELSKEKMAKANELLNEYKHTGPGPRAEQEVLWGRMKAAFDIIYDKKRGQNEESLKLMEEVHAAKQILVDKLNDFLSFKSDRINEWNKKTQELQAVQEQWNALKGPMPRDKAKETSKNFWAGIKTFYRNKSEFFNSLEEERKVNLKKKEELCQLVEKFVEETDTSIENTKKVVSLQQDWKKIGHVPRKQQDSIYKRFKDACDAFFDLKRSASEEQVGEYKENLDKKIALIEQIEKATKDGEIDLKKLPEYRAEFSAIGYVPRKDIQSIQKRFIDAVNSFVKTAGSINGEEKEKLMLKNEVAVTFQNSGDTKAIQKQEMDLKKKLRVLEDDINLLKTNIEFFGRSKNADKLKAEYEKKIEKSELEADKLRSRLELIRAAAK